MTAAEIEGPPSHRRTRGSPNSRSIDAAIHPVDGMRLTSALPLPHITYADPPSKAQETRPTEQSNAIDGTMELSPLFTTAYARAVTVPTRPRAAQHSHATVNSYRLSKISCTSFSASSMMCSGGYCGFHPIFLPFSAVKVHLEVAVVSFQPILLRRKHVITPRLNLLPADLHRHKLRRAAERLPYLLQDTVVRRHHRVVADDVPLGQRRSHGRVEVVPGHAPG